MKKNKNKNKMVRVIGIKDSAHSHDYINYKRQFDSIEFPFTGEVEDGSVRFMKGMMGWLLLEHLVYEKVN